MTKEEKALARIMFKLKINQADGQKFEDLFTSIMGYRHPDFIQIKPWGNIGDRKNDGYLKGEGRFFQVYAPESVESNYPEVVSKLDRDFKGLVSQWSPVNSFNFVLNDKYKGVNADSEIAMTSLKQTNGLSDAKFLLAKDLENELFMLSDDEIISVVGFFPDTQKIQRLDVSVLNEVVDHILGEPSRVDFSTLTTFPDWDSKIQFNGLSKNVEHFLSVGFYQVGQLESYLRRNGDFLADELRSHINAIYISEKSRYTGDLLFGRMIERLSVRQEPAYRSATFVLLAKFFESCDVFEEPSQS